MTPLARSMMMATYEHVTLTITLADGWRRTTYPINRYAAERQARDSLRTYRTDTKIRKTMAPGRITLRHRETGHTAVITLEDRLLQEE